MPRRDIALRHVGIVALGLVACRLSAGVFHTCARRPDATVACWGLNEDGALGNGQVNESNIPVEVRGL